MEISQSRDRKGQIKRCLPETDQRNTGNQGLTKNGKTIVTVWVSTVAYPPPVKPIQRNVTSGGAKKPKTRGKNHTGTRGVHQGSKISEESPTERRETEHKKRTAGE